MPHVGIYFFVDGELVVNAVPIEQGESYVDTIQYGGHYEFWEKLQPRTSAERKMKDCAYDAYPRGRVVYFSGNRTYCIYVDECLKKDDIISIRDAFGLRWTKAEVDYDENYQCAKCNPWLVD